jgi:hypothetical protein
VKDIPIPFNLSGNDRDRRGLPIPFIIYRDKDGTPHFTVDDTGKVNLALAKKLCGLCGKPLKLGQMWLIGGSDFWQNEDELFTAPPAHEDCARYAIQVCPYMAASNYSRLIEEKTLKPHAVHESLDVHNDQIRPQRPLYFTLLRTSGVKLTPAENGSDRKFIAPRRPWRDLEFWRNGQQISRAEAEAMGHVATDGSLETFQETQ